jgi:hypothetical protein
MAPTGISSTLTAAVMKKAGMKDPKARGISRWQPHASYAFLDGHSHCQIEIPRCQLFGIIAAATDLEACAFSGEYSLAHGYHQAIRWKNSETE